MDKRRRGIPKQVIGGGALPAPKVPVSTDGKNPTFRFGRVPKRGAYTLSSWKGRELDDLLDCLRQMENMTWAEIRATSGPLGQRTGLGYTLLKNPRGLGFGPDVKPFEVRVCLTKRIVAHRDNEVCYILRFDRVHAAAGK